MQIPNEISVLLGRSGYDKLQEERWGAFDLFRRVILENNEALEQGLGIKLARPFYERFLQQLLMFDDVFDELRERRDDNDSAHIILDHIKGQLVGKHYQALSKREGGGSIVVLSRALIERIIARRVEKGSAEAMFKQKLLLKKFEKEGEHFLFVLKTEKELCVLRDTLAYVAMVEALQTSSKLSTRQMGDRLAKENYLRVMLAHHILDMRAGFRLHGDVLDQVRRVLEALDRDDNGLLSLKAAGRDIPEDVSKDQHPQLWHKLASYDENGDGYLSAQEQIHLKEAIAGLIQRGKLRDKAANERYSFEEVEAVLVRELPVRA